MALTLVLLALFGIAMAHFEGVVVVYLRKAIAMTGSSWVEKGVFFLWTFAFWDLFYYLSLYILIKWPPTLKTIDVLFLIPVPWIAPVWFPIGVSSLTIITIIVLYIFKILV
jgi:hypothetical protein